mgnify:CR=1 FL=1|tara:strand:+ start:1191 stop:1703 length:513 start_codon:yes stop_codon:yes gene_type:complete
MGLVQDTTDAMLDQWKLERPELDTSGMAVVLRVLQASGAFSERLKRLLEPSNLTPWEFDVLSALRRVGKPWGVPSKDLCESAMLTSGAMSNRIDRLEERGLVKRRPNPLDRRSTMVHLTRKGLARVDRVIGLRMEDAVESVQSLRSKDRAELARLLRLVVLGLEDEVSSD